MPETERTADSRAPEEQRKGVAQPSRTAYIVKLVLGDILVFVLFALFGSGSHGEIKSLADLARIFVIAIPFMLGWFLVAPWLGVYRRKLAADTRAMTIYTLRAWVVAWPVAMFLRWLFVERAHPIPLSSFLVFSLVVLLTVTVILLVWRWPFAWNNWHKEVRARQEEQK